MTTTSTMTTTTPVDRDPRGPIRRITAVEYGPHAALVTLSCGHVREFNATFAYRIGDDARCFACRTNRNLCND